MKNNGDGKKETAGKERFVVIKSRKITRLEKQAVALRRNLQRRKQGLQPVSTKKT